MAGMSQDGKTVYIVTVEGGTKESPGVNCIDIANWMLAHGSWNVVNFDSGGSATIAVDHEMLNYPMRGGEIRPVADALLVVSTEPESETVASYSFVVPNLYTTAVSESVDSFIFLMNMVKFWRKADRDLLTGVYRKIWDTWMQMGYFMLL